MWHKLTEMQTAKVDINNQNSQNKKEHVSDDGWKGVEE